MPSRCAPARFSSASMSASPSSVTTPISTVRSTWVATSIKKPQCELSTSSKNSNIPKASGRASGSGWSRGSSSCCGISSGGRMPTARAGSDTLISRSPARTANRTVCRHRVVYALRRRREPPGGLFGRDGQGSGEDMLLGCCGDRQGDRPEKLPYAISQLDRL